MVAQHEKGLSGRPVRDCAHVSVHHEHGTRLAYVLDRCGCTPCRAANTAAERRRRRAVAYGWPTGLVDATPARAHVLGLRSQGLSVARIAELAGVGHGALVALVYERPGGGATRQIRPQTERRLLEVRFDAGLLPAGRRVAGTGTRQRLQALAASGWSVPALARAGGVGERTLRRALTGASVHAETARAVGALYAQLQASCPPQGSASERTMAERAKRQANSYGWRPPQARLGEDLDDESAADEAAGGHDQAADVAALGPDLDEIAIERAMRGDRVPLLPAERREAVARLTRRGSSARRIAGLLDTSVRTVSRLRAGSADAAAA